MKHNFTWWNDDRMLCDQCGKILPDDEAEIAQEKGTCTPKKEIEPLVAKFEVGKAGLNFHTDLGVFPEGGGTSICYVTSRVAGEFIVEALNHFYRTEAGEKYFLEMRRKEKEPRCLMCGGSKLHPDDNGEPCPKCNEKSEEKTDEKTG